MEFATWPDDFFTKPVCEFVSISVVVHKAHQMRKQGQGVGQQAVGQTQHPSCDFGHPESK